MKFFIFAGEQSGDLHGSHLIKALKEQLPDTVLEGVGGHSMRALGLSALLRVEDFEVMGFSDVLFSLPKLVKQFYQVRDHILRTRPDAVILIDYPGFNLRMAQALRQHNYSGKIIHYICPSVWAWGKSRIPKMAKNLDLLLAIYPFEPAHFAHTSLDVRYIGNPLSEIIRAHSYDDRWYHQAGLPDTSDLIALFPGSRKGEIIRNLPLQLAAARLIQEEFPNTRFAISSAHDEVLPLVAELLRDSPLIMHRDLVLVPKVYTYELMRDACAAIAKSGTVTMELALHHCPTVVMYPLTMLNHFIAKYLLNLRLPHYCIANIVANRTVFPEMIGKNLSEEALANQLRTLYRPGNQREECMKQCEKMAGQMETGKRASDKAVEAIREILGV